MSNQSQQSQEEYDPKQPTRAMQWFALIILAILAAAFIAFPTVAIFAVFYLKGNEAIFTSVIGLVGAISDAIAFKFAWKRMATFVFPLSNEKSEDKIVDEKKGKMLRENFEGAVKYLTEAIKMPVSKPPS